MVRRKWRKATRTRNNGISKGTEDKKREERSLLGTSRRAQNMKGSFENGDVRRQKWEDTQVIVLQIHCNAIDICGSR